ncbi:LysR family transcriptional regulator [Vibrio sp. JPW-9-11-11]|uniref:LysR family transcriptional regulator n=1 Tax=Vibrio sp. JPW-9-11-11 TaxID=1416532 RepID=UPI0015946306|nr:LysR family transcriptional regulator [Vibrio sp. JPW-9-11-11]NVD06499.1 LysR family transcriptional regulator [Vibrio sp. JPW-9-11-11]
MNKSYESQLHRLTQAAPMLAAIARELSFTRAAEQLGIQQSAVSHRVRSLEQALGLRLFERTTRELRLTPAGKIVCEAATQAVSIWPSALAQLTHLDSKEQIRLSVSSSLAMKWLIPLLSSSRDFGITIALTVDDEHSNFALGNIDAAIRFGAGPYPGLHSVHLCHSYIQPVASPDLCEQQHNNREDIFSQFPLLADRRGEQDGTQFYWRYYFDQIGTNNSASSAALMFDRADLMLQAAINGMGIGLGHTLLIEQDLESGFLRRVGPSVKLETSYWLVSTPNFAQTERHAQLHRWLKSLLKKR